MDLSLYLPTADGYVRAADKWTREPVGVSMLFYARPRTNRGLLQSQPQAGNYRSLVGALHIVPTACTCL